MRADLSCFPAAFAASAMFVKPAGCPFVPLKGGGAAAGGDGGPCNLPRASNTHPHRLASTYALRASADKSLATSPFQGEDE